MELTSLYLVSVDIFVIPSALMMPQVHQSWLGMTQLQTDVLSLTRELGESSGCFSVQSSPIHLQPGLISSHNDVFPVFVSSYQ